MDDLRIEHHWENLMLEFGKALNVGLKRQGKKNQDALKIIDPLTKDPLLVVADGMGGFKGGREASQIVIKTLTRGYRHSDEDEPLRNVLVNAILSAHQKIIQRSKTDAALAKMGSTVACVVVDEDQEKLTVANVGDTRVYLIHSNEVKRISHDHSEVAELERKGVLNPVEAQNYIRKNVLTMSLAAHRPPEKVKPFVDEVDFPKGSLVLLCSDGLWGSVPDHLIQLTALEYKPKEAVEKLVEFANTSGGPDNISILIARRRGEWREYRKKITASMDDTL
jgi:PPM family protein phosphatase